MSGAGGTRRSIGAQQKSAGRAELSVTYDDVLEVLVVRLLVDPRIYDLGLLGLQGLQLLLGKVLDVPVVVLLRVRPLKVLVLRS